MPSSFQVTIWWLEAWYQVWGIGFGCLLLYFLLKRKHTKYKIQKSY